MSFVISLTTIPPRFSTVGETVASLVRQSLPAASVRLYLPRNYRRFGPLPATRPSLPEGVQVRITDTDFGPATKVLPAARELAGGSLDILFCDDDRIYDRDWAKRFADARRRKPEACIVAAGYDIADRAKLGFPPFMSNRHPRASHIRKDLRYRLTRIMTAGQRKPNSIAREGYVDILEGQAGAMVRPSMLPDFAFAIPDHLWTVDDPWLSGCLTANGVPIWAGAAGRWALRGTAGQHTDPLFRLVYRGLGRTEADRACIAYFRDNYGLWRDPPWNDRPRQPAG